MNASEAPQKEKQGWAGRFLVYLGLVVGIPWLAAEVAFRDCVANEPGGGGDSLCGLAYLAVTPIAFVIVLVVVVVVEIVLRSRRK